MTDTPGTDAPPQGHPDLDAALYIQQHSAADDRPFIEIQPEDARMLVIGYLTSAANALTMQTAGADALALEHTNLALAFMEVALNA